MGARKSLLRSAELLRLHKVVKTLSLVANTCPDEDLKRSLQSAAGQVLGVIEFVQTIERYKARKKANKFDLDPL